MSQSAKITVIEAMRISSITVVILHILSCGYTIKTDTFRKYTMETVKLVLKHHPWTTRL